MDQLYYLTVLRSVHIITGVFWAGAGFYLAWFVMPAVKATGPEGGKFMQQLGKTNRLPFIMTSASFLNILTGLLLLWELSGGFQSAWLFSRHGIIVLAGSILALAAFLEGLFLIRPTVAKMNALSVMLAKAGGPPQPSQLQQLMNYRNTISAATLFSSWLLAGAVIFMSLVRYL